MKVELVYPCIEGDQGDIVDVSDTRAQALIGLGVARPARPPKTLDTDAN